MVQRDVIRLVWLGSLLLYVALAGGCSPQRDQVSRSDSAGPPLPVEVTIDWGGGAERTTWQVQVPPGSTVLDCLHAARQTGGLEFSYRGEGTTAFLTSLAGIANGGGVDDNWIFRVDGQLASASCGAVQVRSGAKIEWVRGAYRGE